MPSVSVGITDDNDDGVEFKGAWTNTQLQFSRATSGAQAVWGGMRFLNVTVPKGAIIDAATIAIDRTSTSGTPDGLRIHGVGEDNPAAFSSSRLPVTHLSAGKTTAFYTYVNGDPAVLNVASIVQELVNRAGWVSGNAMAFINIPIDLTAGLVGFADYNTSGYAQLAIDYTLPPASNFMMFMQ